ncbi:MAG: methyltransferase family protein [Planctomycetota bacterium]
MKTSWTVLIIFTAIVAVRHLFQLFYRSRREKGGEASGHVTTALLFVCYVSIWVTASILLVRGVEMGAFFISGAVVFVAGVAVRLVSIVTLGAYYSETIEIRKDHALVQRGIYSLIRHPLHLAFVLELGGMALMAQWWWLAAPMAVLLATVTARNFTEDRKLEAKFAGEFRDYASRVPAVNLPIGIFRRIVARKKFSAGGNGRAD